MTKSLLFISVKDNFSELCRKKCDGQHFDV